MNEYTFFWNGPFSQWYPSKFSVDGIAFNCAEQYMMYMKALTFKDEEIAEKILNSNSPKEQKALGRQVKNFDENIWSDVCKLIVRNGNYFKFTQNPELFEVLKKTYPTILVEASPYDFIWGIGLDEETAKNTPSHLWPGKNYLGLILTKLRNELITMPIKYWRII